MDESEWQTRKCRIGTGLRSVRPPWRLIRWRAGLDPFSLHPRLVTEFATADGPGEHARFISGSVLSILRANEVSVTLHRNRTAAPQPARAKENSPAIHRWVPRQQPK